MITTERESAILADGCTIMQASGMTGLSSHTIRYYEKEELIPPVKRDYNGNRVFAEGDIGWLRLVNCLRKTGMPIAEIRAIAQLSIQGDRTITERKHILENHRANLELRLEELRDAFERINSKIEWYSRMEKESKIGQR